MKVISMSLLKKLIFAAVVLVCAGGIAAAAPVLSGWITLSSDSRDTVRETIRTEVDRREGYSTFDEEKSNFRAVEDEKARVDAAYKKAVSEANREFIRAKKRRDDLTTQFQVSSSELEESTKNLKNTRVSIENLDNQIARYEQDIATQQASLKKWLQTEKQGEALVAVIYTRGFKDRVHVLESQADQVSAPLMAQHMGTYIQSFTKVIDNVTVADFIRAIEEGTAKWNNEEPYRVELDKGPQGTTYLRLKRYELYPFQEPKGGRVKPAASPVKATIITSKKDLESFLAQNGHTGKDVDFGRVTALIHETLQNNTVAENNLSEQVKSFKERIATLQDKIRASRNERETHADVLKKREEQNVKMAQSTETLKAKRDAAEREFHEAQSILDEKRKVHDSIIIKTALAAARGSQSPAEASAEAIIDKLAEVKNDAKMQHSSTTTEVTNFQVTDESSMQAVTDAQITSLRLISFINKGDSVQVNMAFRVRTVLAERDGRAATRVAAAPPREPEREPDREPDREPAVKTPGPAAEKPPARPLRERLPKWKIGRATPPPVPPPEPLPVSARKDYPVLAAAELKECLFELRNISQVRNEVHILVQVTNQDPEGIRYVALYDKNYRWTKSTLADRTGKIHDVTDVVFLEGDKKVTMYEKGKYGIELAPQGSATVKLVFKDVPGIDRAGVNLNLHPFVYYHRTFGTTWQEGTLPMRGIRPGR